MGWDVGSTGLQIVLGAEVPELVETYLADDVDAVPQGARPRRSATSTGGSATRAARRSSRRSSPPRTGRGRPAHDLATRCNAIGNLSSASVLHVLPDTLRRTPGRAGRRRRPDGDGAGVLRRTRAAAVVTSMSEPRSVHRAGRRWSRSSGWPNWWSPSATWPGACAGRSRGRVRALPVHGRAAHRTARRLPARGVARATARSCRRSVGRCWRWSLACAGVAVVVHPHPGSAVEHPHRRGARACRG